MIIHTRLCPVSSGTCLLRELSRRLELSLWICTAISSMSTRLSLWRRLLMLILISICGTRVTRDIYFRTGSSLPTPNLHLCWFTSGVRVSTTCRTYGIPVKDSALLCYKPSLKSSSTRLI
ncbi:hypothetical protein M758_UG039300 [Ceratodon purpureus]|nr:hypothetical protein M758_UG039300 [Ceratodon purpureus]